MPGRAHLASVVDLVAPRLCASCGGPGRSSVCRRCWRGIGDSRRAGGLVVEAAVSPVCAAFARYPYGGALARLIVARKDGGRRDLREPLATLLLPALIDALTAAAAHAPGLPTILVPAPSSAAAQRRRGERPVADLVRGLLADRDHPEVAIDEGLLRLNRRVSDQSGLGRAQRRANLDGAIAAARDIRGTVIVIDDVITTGATMSAAGQALRAAGARHVFGAAIAATPRGVRSAPGPQLARR